MNATATFSAGENTNAGLTQPNAVKRSTFETSKSRALPM
jgi:hypothetical protein